MTADILPFPDRRALERDEKPNPFVFWVGLLTPMSPYDRHQTIAEAHRHGAIDDEDQTILVEMWPKDKESYRDAAE